MTYKKTTVWTALIVVVLLGLAAPVTADGHLQVIGQPGLSTSVSENQVSPGEETTIEFYIQNRGNIRNSGPTEYTDRVTTARAVTVDVRDAEEPISVQTNSVSIGNIPTGTSGPHRISLTVPEATEPGTYKIPIRLDYQYTWRVDYGSNSPEFFDRSRTKDATLRVDIEEQARFDVVQADATVPIDGNDDVSVTVQNTGTEPARDISLTASSPSAELAVGEGSGSATAYIAQLEPDEQQTVTYNGQLAEDAPKRDYTVNLNAEYSDTDGITQTSDSMRFGVGTIPEQSFRLSDIDATLQAGMDGNLVMTVTNTGPNQAENVVLNWQSDHSNISPEETQYAVGTLASGESDTVRFGVDISDSAEAGPRQFDFTATYREPDGDRRESDMIEAQAPIEGQSDVFSVDATGTTIRAGQSSEIELTVTNTGSEQLTDISAKLFTDSPISADDDEAFASGLGPGESTTLIFSISAEGGAIDKTYPLSLDFQYEEPDGDTPVSDTYRVPVEVTTASGGSGLPLVPIGAGVLVVLLGVGLYIRSRRQ